MIFSTEGWLQRLADFLLALEPAGPGNVALELHVGHFDGDDLAGFAVARLVNARHPAAADALENFKPVVEHGARAVFLFGLHSSIL